MSIPVSPIPASLTMRPGPQPWNAGITPGYRNRHKLDFLATRRDLKREATKLRREMEELAALIVQIERRLSA